MWWLRGIGESHPQPAFGDSMMRVEALSCDDGLGGGTEESVQITSDGQENEKLFWTMTIAAKNGKEKGERNKERR